MKDKKVKILNLILPIASILAIIVVWIVAYYAVGNDSIMPSFSETLVTFFSLFAKGEFYLALGGTLLRTIISFVVSFVLAFGLALLSYKVWWVKKVLSPIVSIVRVLPTIAVVLLLLVWTNSFIAPIIVALLVVFPTTYTGVESVLSSIDEKQLEMCKVFGVDEKTVLKKVKIPQILPSTINIAGTALSLTLKLMVAAEVLSYTTDSIGNYLQLAKLYDNTVIMMALVLVTVVIGVVIEMVFSLISKKVGKWQ